MQLRNFFEENPSVALAFSGGVDSAYLLYAAKAYGAQAKAYYVNTPFQPAFELEDARHLAAVLEADMQVLELDVLEDENIRSNPANRCYYCKKKIISAILQQAKADGFTVVIDGTNASDDVSGRPGMAALGELGVLSPLRICGLTKAHIRRLSKEAGLFTHDKPAYACLATRIPNRTPITRELLERTEWAEEYLKELGFSNFRVRVLGNCAKLEIQQSQISLLLTHRTQIVNKLKKKYSNVLLDLEVRDE